MRFELEIGVAVAKFWTAKARGSCFEVAKSTDDNEIPPEKTSGTPERVVVEPSQVTAVRFELQLGERLSRLRSRLLRERCEVLLERMLGLL